MCAEETKPKSIKKHPVEHEQKFSSDDRRRNRDSSFGADSGKTYKIGNPLKTIKEKRYEKTHVTLTPKNMSQINPHRKENYYGS